MSVAGEIVRDAASGVVVADTIAGLETIAKPGCAAVIWRRDPAPDLQAWIDWLDPEQLPSLRTVVRPGAVADAVRRSCDLAGAPESPERAMLIEDIAALSARFAAIMATPYLRVRLDVVQSNACRKFHIDMVTARLICTYRGSGTQYGVSSHGAEPSPIHTAPTGAPLILRGTLWPEEPRSGLLHRSPPIEGSGETRLLLVLDPIETATEEPDQAVH